MRKVTLIIKGVSSAITRITPVGAVQRPAITKASISLQPYNVTIVIKKERALKDLRRKIRRLAKDKVLLKLIMPKKFKPSIKDNFKRNMQLLKSCNLFARIANTQGT